VAISHSFFADALADPAAALADPAAWSNSELGSASAENARNENEAHGVPSSGTGKKQQHPARECFDFDFADFELYRGVTSAPCDSRHCIECM
jgi:hypothetical protein